MTFVRTRGGRARNKAEPNLNEAIATALWKIMRRVIRDDKTTSEDKMKLLAQKNNSIFINTKYIMTIRR